ncbi:acetoacetate--CoA ligase [Cytobacillus sp. Hz8]|uniref:acetoacetate--CoA ligase n=1 Tax=Cytobacillus sp. Hz8 TaxID=3347168 RepID=UPI0035DC6CCA
MKPVTEGKLLWSPTEEQIKQTSLVNFMKWVNEQQGTKFETYQDLWKWSVLELEDFWESVWKFCQVKASAPYYSVLNMRQMPEAKWFQGAKLNYADNVFKNYKEDKTALFFRSERVAKREVSWKELREKTASIANSLKSMGVKPGDRVVAYMPNILETVIAFLACASIGAIWSSCSPDFGASSVVDRFKQIEPVVLFTIDGYQYNGKTFNCLPVVTKLQEELTFVKHTILVPYLNQITPIDTLQNFTSWDSLLSNEQELQFEQVPFDHPLWILYSSGTTGLPKPIVQGQGGILLEHLKVVNLQQNLSAEDVFFWYTTTGWMMWNFLLGGLLVGSTIVLYDGSPSYPSIDILWSLIEESGTTFFGTSAGYISSCVKAGIIPRETHNLSKLKGIGSTGSPLMAEGFSWTYANVKEDLWLVSTSGGTDVCTAFVGGCSILPVRAGELQARALGANVQSFDEEGNSLVNEVGELVITAPMPSMPLFFWNDENQERYLNSYFDIFPGIWRHGDWIKIDEKGSSVIFGRSDSTINRQGVRLGTSEIYRVVEGLEEILEGLVIDLEMLGRNSHMPLFVVLKENAYLDDQLKQKIKNEIRHKISPRFVPDEIYEVEEIPKTISGKKLEVPIRKILLGFEVEKVANPDSMSNPHTLHYYQKLAEQLNQEHQNK